MEGMVLDEDALMGMKSLLGAQFNDTLDFCYSEFDRLNVELEQTIQSDNETAIRHAHSLKSNAAQFGALLLAEMAKSVEHALSDGDLDIALKHATLLPEYILLTKQKMDLWKSNSNE